MVNQILDLLRKQYPLQEIPVGEFAKCKVSGMTFRIQQYEAEGLGNVSVMTGKAMLGLMKMDTVIINPFEKDAPLFSYDRIHAMGNDTLFLEIYDTRIQINAIENPLTEVVARYKDLPDRISDSNWYDSIRWKESVMKKGKKASTPSFDSMTREYTEGYLKIVEKSPLCDREIKKKKASEYTEGLLSNGGPSTDAFLKGYGAEKTAELYRCVLFGTGN